MPQLRNSALNPYMLALLVIAISVIGGALVLRFAGIQQNREIMQWQNKLNLIADSRASDIDEWLDRQFKDLGSVATNPSLQLYLTQILSAANEAKPAEEPAQATYLRDLLSITADRMGFTEQQSAELKSINADVQQASGVGLALLDMNGKFLVSTGGLVALDPAIAKQFADAPKKQPSLIDLYVSASGQTRMGFILPVYPIQGAATDAPAGMLVAIRNVGNSFFGLLHSPGITDKTLEAVLLRKDGDNVVFLSPGENKAASATFALATPDLDAAYAVTGQGNFAVKLDRQSHATLMTSRAIPHSPWVVMVHIDRDQALAESDQWRRQTEYIMLFALLAMIGGIVAVWYYGTSKRTLLLSIETGRLATKLAAQEKLLRVVADNQLEPILIVDASNVAHFANEKAARTFQMPSEAVAGKDLTALMGLARAEEYQAANQIALRDNKPFLRTWRKGDEPNAQVIQSEHVPLPHIPIDRLAIPSPGVLIIDQDVSAVVHERERRMRTLQQLVNALVYLVDKRDPNAANHSMGVALAAREMAAEAELDLHLTAVAETAGKLMNIGKIMVPSKLLTKEAPLAEDEIRLIRESLQESVALLESIEFEGPVVDTLRQMQERFDGSGPLGLRGEATLITARIIAVANAYIGMVSPRSYRGVMDSDQAIKTLMQASDTQFDRRAVVALANFVANRGGKETLARLMSGRR